MAVWIVQAFPNDLNKTARSRSYGMGRLGLTLGAFLEQLFSGPAGKHLFKHTAVIGIGQPLEAARQPSAQLRTARPCADKSRVKRARYLVVFALKRPVSLPVALLQEPFQPDSGAGHGAAQGSTDETQTRQAEQRKPTMRHRRYRDVTPASRTLGIVMTKPADGAAQKGCTSSVPTSHEDRGSSLEVGLLAELRVALADQNIHSELRPDVPCLSVAMEAAPDSLWVFVSHGGRYFSWNDAVLQHPVFDMQGVVHRITTQFLGETEGGAK